MNRFHLLRAALLAAPLALGLCAAEKPAGGLDSPPVPDAPRALPPVLRGAEPADNRIVVLPGAPTPPPSAPAAGNKPGAADRAPAELATSVPPRTERSLPPPPPSAARTEAAPAAKSALLQSPGVKAERARPVTPPRKPAPPVPAEFSRDSAAFCQKLVGEWNEMDARAMLGPPLRSRPSFGDGDSETGRVLAFADPTGRYRQLELDFDLRTQRLKTVFAYPRNLAWADCQRLWGSNVAATGANKGRTFYSYTDRRLDVLVEPTGKVVSIGLY